VLAGMILAFAFVPVAVFAREPSDWSPEEGGLYGKNSSAPGLTVAQAFRQSWRFWALNIAFFVFGMSTQGSLAHVVAILTDRGVGLQAASGALSLAGLAMILGRIACGYGLDRLYGPSIAFGCFLALMIGIALLASGTSASIALPGIFLCGIAQGAQIGLLPFFASRYFGLRSIGAISGVMFGFFFAGLGIGPYISGACFDFWHSYVPALAAYVVVLASTSLLFIPLGPYPYAPRSLTI
jgi:cyanate permease